MEEIENVNESITEETQELDSGVENAPSSTASPVGNDGSAGGTVRDTKQGAQLVSDEADEATPFIKVRYNHKDKELTKSEATQAIQMGLHTEDLRKRLEYAAALKGITVNKLVDDIIKEPENNYREYLNRAYGEGSAEAQAGLKVFREQQKEKYGKIMAERENEKVIRDKLEEKSILTRMAEQYCELKKEIEDAPKYAALPDEVIIEAATGKRDLYSAYLCYLNREKNKIEAARKVREAAENSSAGSMKSGGRDNVSSRERSFLAGLWSK